MKLLHRLYEPDAGRILIDGYDINKLQLPSVRRQIGIVPQDSLLFDGTVRDNISLVAQPVRRLRLLLVQLVLMALLWNCLTVTPHASVNRAVPFLAVSVSVHIAEPFFNIWSAYT